MAEKTRDSLIFKALRKEPLPRTPVWIMRQAGRYLPEYRKAKKGIPLLEAFHSPTLAEDLTLQPVELIGADAAIIYSDILLVPEALGLKLDYIPDVGPVFANPVRSSRDISNLNLDEGYEERMSFIWDSIGRVRRNLDDSIPLIGFAGSPWTLASYMVEGKGSRNFTQVKSFLYDEPEDFGRLLDILTEAVVRSLKAQITAGADLVQIFDSWAGALTPEQFRRISLPSIKRIVEAIGGDVPTIVFAKGGGHSLEAIAGTGADAVSIDWATDLSEAVKSIGDRVTLQGNLDPTALFGNTRSVEREVRKVLSNFGDGFGHIFNLGHGVLPETPVENVKTLIQAVRELSPAYKMKG